MSQTPDFTRLVAESRSQGGDEAWARIWKSLFMLPSWYSFGDAERPNAPMLAMLKDQPTVLIFTEERLARDFAVKHGYAASRDEVRVVRLDLPAVFSYLNQLHERGAKQVVFNAGDDAFGRSLEGFDRLPAAVGVAWEAQPAPAAEPVPASTADTTDPAQRAELDRLVDAFRTDPTQANDVALFRFVFALEKWHFIGRGETPDVHPFIGEVDGKPMLATFTDARLAHHFAVRNNLTVAGGAFAMLEMPIEAAVDYMERLAPQGVAAAIFNPGDHGFFAPLANLRPMLDYFKQA